MLEKKVEELEAAIEKREKLEGTKIFKMLRNLNISNYAVNKNHQELSLAIASYEGNLEIWDANNRQKVTFFLRELSRLLHNYLSSTFSLIRHNSNICNEINCVELNQEYSKEVNALKLNDCYWFVKEFRNFAQHVGLPILSAKFSFSRTQGNSEFKQRILLDKDILVNWKGWEKGSKYINSHKEIDLKLVINEYQILVRNFHIWFNRRVNQVYSKQLQEFAEAEREVGRLNRELFNKS